MNVIATAPMWTLSGVNTFSENLVRGLQAAGAQASILLTDPNRHDSKPMPLPAGVPVETLRVGRLTGWRARWRTLIRYLEERAPCIYLPNWDFWCSCVSPKLSSGVGVVGIVHSDDPRHYAHTIRLGRYWNAVVAVSQVVAERVTALDLTLTPRLVTIPYGVAIPSRLPERPWNGSAPLKIVYAGRLVQRQKRILDLAQVALQLAERGLAAELTIIGGGMEQRRLMDICAGLVTQGRVRFLGVLSNDRVSEILEQNDVFILTSEFEGLPLSLLEAMGRGCIPVVTDIRSGIPEVVQDGVNGFCVPVGDVQGFVECLALLQRDTALRRELASRAYRAVSGGGYRTEDMVQHYLALFERVSQEAENGVYVRPEGKILYPPEMTWGDRLPPLVRAMIGRGKHMLFSRGVVQ